MAGCLILIKRRMAAPATPNISLHKRRSTFSESDCREVLPRQWSLKEKCESKTMGNLDEPNETDLSLIQPVPVAFIYEIDNKIYRLHNFVVRSASTKTAPTAKLANCMETFKKPRKIQDPNSMTIIFFVSQFKRSCDSDGVSEVAAIWLLQFFMTKHF